jgi:hypothetical protein
MILDGDAELAARDYSNASLLIGDLTDHAKGIAKPMPTLPPAQRPPQKE